MKVGVLGAGAMGSRMSLGLLLAGHDVTVWNRTPARAEPLAAHGATIVSRPAEAADGVDVVLSVVRDDEASRDVWIEGMALEAMSPGSIGIESSTLSVGHVRALAAAFVERGQAFLDAPVLGSRPQAEARALIHLVGGEEQIFDRAAPVFAAVGSAAHHIGPPGSGAALKLLANALFSVQVAAVAELLSGATALGLVPDRVVEVLGSTPVLGPAAKGAALGMLTQAFAPAFPIDLVEKDLAYLGDALPDAPVSAAARKVFEQASARGCGAENITAVARLYV